MALRVKEVGTKKPAKETVGKPTTQTKAPTVKAVRPTGTSASQIEAAIRNAQAAVPSQTTTRTVTPVQTEAAATNAAANETAATETTETSTQMGITDTPKTALEKLLAQYNSTPLYQQRTDEERQARAEGQYQSYYDQLRLAAQQQQERSDLALSQQRDNIARSYDDTREATAQQYGQAYSQADRQLLSRGMARSTYGAQTLANIATQGAEAQQRLWERQGQDQSQVDAQRAQLAMQLAGQLSQYDKSQASDIMNRVRELEDQDYERGMQSAQYQNQLTAQLYGYLLDAYKNGYLTTNSGASDFSGISSSIASSMARQMQAAGYTGTGGTNNNQNGGDKQKKQVTSYDLVAGLSSARTPAASAPVTPIAASAPTSGGIVARMVNAKLYGR